MQALPRNQHALHQLVSSCVYPLAELPLREKRLLHEVRPPHLVHIASHATRTTVPACVKVVQGGGAPRGAQAPEPMMMMMITTMMMNGDDDDDDDDNGDDDE